MMRYATHIHACMHAGIQEHVFFLHGGCLDEAPAATKGVWGGWKPIARWMSGLIMSKNMEAMRAEEEAAINHREEDGGSLESADDNQRLAELVLVSRRDLRPKLLAALLDVRFAVKHAVDLPLLHEVGHLEVLITHCGQFLSIFIRPAQF